MSVPVAFEPKHWFRPFHLVPCRGSGTNRLGGQPPEGIRPTVNLPNARYLATLALTGDLDVSLFADFGGPDSDPPFLDYIYQLQNQDNTLIQFELHSRLPVTRDSALESPVPACELKFGDLDQDLDPTRADHHTALTQCFEDHKVGGIPFFEHLEGTVYEESLPLLQSGYFHILQLAFPGSSDLDLDCDWPFGTTWIFHVFAKVEPPSWRFIYAWS